MKKDIKKQDDEMVKMISAWKDSIKTLPGNMQASIMQQANDTSQLVSQAMKQTFSPTLQSKSPIGEQKDFFHVGKNYSPTGKQIGHASQGAPTGGPQNQPIPVTLVGGSGITVNFTGKCPHCGWNQQHSEQATITNAPSQSTNR